MNIFSSIRRAKEELAMQHEKIEEILCHRYLVARGFLYRVEYQGKYYILVNSYDLEAAVGALPTYQQENMELSPNIWGIPLYEDSEKIRRVVGGIYHVLDGNSFLFTHEASLPHSSRH